MRRAAAAHGLPVLALSPWKIAIRDDPGARAALRAATAADIVIVTSPAAVRAAASLGGLRMRRSQRWCAVGVASARALARTGIAGVAVPARMDSEGLLALPVLQAVEGVRIGLLTAPGGRDRIAPELRLRGAEVLRADVYERVALPLPLRGLARLRAQAGPLLLPVSSGEALERLFAQAPDDIAARLREAQVLAASERIAAIARDHGCRDVRIATGPRPAQLFAALSAPA